LPSTFSHGTAQEGLPAVSLEEVLQPIEEWRPEGLRLPRPESFWLNRPLILERAIENLPPGYRIIFVLLDVEG